MHKCIRFGNYLKLSSGEVLWWQIAVLNEISDLKIDNLPPQMTILSPSNAQIKNSAELFADLYLKICNYLQHLFKMPKK